MSTAPIVEFTVCGVCRCNSVSVCQRERRRRVLEPRERAQPRIAVTRNAHRRVLCSTVERGQLRAKVAEQVVRRGFIARLAGPRSLVMYACDARNTGSAVWGFAMLSLPSCRPNRRRADSPIVRIDPSRAAGMISGASPNVMNLHTRVARWSNEDSFDRVEFEPCSDFPPSLCPTDRFAVRRGQPVVGATNDRVDRDGSFVVGLRRRLIAHEFAMPCRVFQPGSVTRRRRADRHLACEVAAHD